MPESLYQKAKERQFLLKYRSLSAYCVALIQQADELDQPMNDITTGIPEGEVKVMAGTGGGKTAMKAVFDTLVERVAFRVLDQLYKDLTKDQPAEAEKVK